MDTLVRDLSAAEFDRLVARDDRPLLVDFWADWCGPCKAMTPTLDELAREYAGEVDIAKVDVVANPGLAARIGARSIPLLVMFRHGQETARVTGSQSKTRLAAFIDANGLA